MFTLDFIEENISIIFSGHPVHAHGESELYLPRPCRSAALLENHVVAHPICKSAILGEHKMKSKAGNRLTFQCDR